MRNIAIRELAYFVYESGNLTNELSFNNSHIEGKNIHSLRQAEYKDGAIKEYYINKRISYKENEYNLVGFVDGVLRDDTSLILEEIKTTSKEIYSEKFEPAPEHLAQLKIYGYLMLLDRELESAILNLLYIERSTLTRRNYKYELSKKELENFFFTTLDIYLSFFNEYIERAINRLITTKSLNFPYDKIRDGQDQMIEAIKETFTNNDIIYTLAPTGIGKTMSSLYSGLKAMQEIDDKLFYLTAKNSGKESAIKAMKLLIKKGLKAKALVLTAKKKICLLKAKACNPDECPFAKNFFTKLKEATRDVLKNNDVITEDIILDYSFKYEICSFEFSLNISTNVDVIICDYNYVFDPKAKLIRFFEEGTFRPYLLIDEAHNLLARSMDMYSASFSIFDLLKLKKLVADFTNNPSKDLLYLINYIHKKYDSLILNDYYYDSFTDIEIENYLFIICDKIQFYLENTENVPNKEAILEGYFLLKDYLRISRLAADNHIFLIKLINNNLYISLKCMDASFYLSDIIKNHTKGAAFFSATLYPINYYKNLLTMGEGNYLELESPFDSNRFKVIASPLTTRYNERLRTLPDLVGKIKAAINPKKGKYIVFFPSYEYLNMCSDFLELDDYEIIKQTQGLTEFEQRDLINRFKGEGNILGLFVLGGIFSEGIDLIGDLLHGVIVVGVGFLQINVENELLKTFYQEKYQKGLEYAYVYPGFNKVIQAAGRVIRTETDKGFLLLLDDRYRYKSYQELFPKHWKNLSYLKTDAEIEEKLAEFWLEK